MTGNSLSKSRGFSLIEVMIALLLLMMVLIPLLQVVSRGLIAGSETDSTLIAVNLAKDKLEKIKNLSFANVISESRTSIPGFSAFEREVIVTSVHSRLKDVEVKVYWIAEDGSDVNVNLKTLIAGYISI